MEGKSRIRAVLLTVGGLGIVGAVVVAVLIVQLPDYARWGPRTGTTVSATVITPPEIELEGDAICYELDLAKGDYGAEVALRMRNQSPLDTLKWRITAKSGEVARSYSGAYLMGKGPETKAQTLVLTMGDFDGKMVEIPRGLTACHVVLEMSQD